MSASSGTLAFRWPSTAWPAYFLRWLRLVVVFAVAALAVVACTPPPDSRVAAAYVGPGQIEILAFVCEGYQGGRVSVYEVDGGGEGSVWAVGAPTTDAGYAERDYVIRFSMFDIPDGWLELEDTLTSLESGVRYALSFSTVQGQGSNIVFTVDQLERIGTDVWTGRTRHERAVSEAKFLDIARNNCD